MNKSALKDRLASLEGMSDDEIREPSNMPVAIFLREAEEMIAAARRDSARFEAVGFAGERLDELKLRVAALRKAESLWMAARFGRSEARGVWDEMAPEGFELRDELRAALLFVLRSDKDMVSLVRDVGNGRTAGELVQTLSNLAVLADSSRDALEGINFDMSLIERAGMMADELGVLLGRSDAEGDESHSASRLRNAAFTHLKEGLKELRDYALYIFRKDRKRLRDYTSSYLRKKRILRKKRATQESVQATEAVKHEVSLDRGCKGDKKPIAQPMDAFSQEKSEKGVCSEAKVHGMGSPEVSRERVKESKMAAEWRTNTVKVRTGATEQRMNTIKVRNEAIEQCITPLEVRTEAMEQSIKSIKLCTNLMKQRHDGGNVTKNSHGIK